MAKRRGAGEGTLYWNERLSRWVGAVSITLANGRRVRKYVYGRTQREALQRLAKLRQSLQAGRIPTPERLTLGQWLDEWLELTRQKVRPSTLRFYEVCARHIKEYLGSTRLVALQPVQVQQFLHAKQDSLAPATVRGILVTLRRALTVAERLGYVERNVAKLVDPIHVPRPQLQALSPDQARQYLEAARQERLYPVFATLLGCGLRIGEALGLRWQDVDLEAGRLTVAFQLQWRKDDSGRKPVLVEPKARASRRTLPLPALVREALAHWRSVQDLEAQTVGYRGNPFGLVFTTTHGTPLDARDVLRVHQRVLARAGLPRIRLHDLRHSTASLLIAQGASPKLVAEILGHREVAFTLQTYGHLFEDAKKAAAEAMDRMLQPSPDLVAVKMAVRPGSERPQ